MHRSLVGRIVIVLSALAITASIASAELTPEQQRLNLESFDHVWTTIRDKHFDTTFGGLNWQAVRDELRPKMDSARDVAEAGAILRKMVSRLGLSHFAIIPVAVYERLDGPSPKASVDGVTGIDVRVLDNRPIVVRVDDGTPAFTAGVKPGWEILKVGEEELAPMLQPIASEFAGKLLQDMQLARAVTGRLRGAVGDSLKIVFLDGDDRQAEKFIQLIQPRGKQVRFGNLPPYYLSIAVDTLPDNIGYFAFNCFFDPMSLTPAFQNAVNSFTASPGLIIDLRGNPGGVAGIGMGLAGWLAEGNSLYLGTLSTRDTKLKLVINPRSPSFTGPVALLVDGLSGSTAEIFAGGLQDLGRARVFGTPTAGAALPAAIERLPNGDGFMYAIAGYVSQSGKVLEGQGVTPDERVNLTREALLEGRDPVRDAAVEWIRLQNQARE